MKCISYKILAQKKKELLRFYTDVSFLNKLQRTANYVYICIAELTDICTESHLKAGVEGTITGSLNEDQLRDKGTICSILLTDVPPLNVVELSIDIYSIPSTCTCSWCYYIKITGFIHSNLEYCQSTISPVYTYKTDDRDIKIDVLAADSPSVLEFNIMYRSEYKTVCAHNLAIVYW